MFSLLLPLAKLARHIGHSANITQGFCLTERATRDQFIILSAITDKWLALLVCPKTISKRRFH